MTELHDAVSGTSEPGRLWTERATAAAYGQATFTSRARQ
jgi:hypothetical protein